MGWFRPIKATAIPVKPYPAGNPETILWWTPRISLILNNPAKPPEINIAIIIFL